MYGTHPQEIFLKGTHGVGRQDKKPPGRFEVGLSEPLTAAADPETANNHQQNRQTHHGSETRQTANIAGLGSRYTLKQKSIGSELCMDGKSPKPSGP